VPLHFGKLQIRFRSTSHPLQHTEDRALLKRIKRHYTSGVAALSRLYGLSSDATINAKAGADALNAKFQAANSVGTDVPTILEDWYNALLAYNGVAPKNYPLQTKDPFGTYQHKVFTQIAKGPLWPPTSTLGEPDKNDVGKYTTLADGTVLLPPEIPYTPFPIHQEAGFNGAIDAVILPTYKKTFSASATNPSQVLLTMTNMTTYAMGNVLVQSATAVFNSGQNVPTSIISGPKAVLTAGSSTSFTLQLSSTGTVIDVRPAMKCSTYSDNLQFR
jgi:hypothetical protein